MTDYRKFNACDNLDCCAFADRLAEWAELPAAAPDWRQIDAVIFDMDGTLVDSMYYWMHLSDDWFVRQGLAVPDELPEEFATMDLWEAAGVLARDFAAKPTSQQEVFDELQADIDRHYAEDIPLMEGREALLQALQRAGKPACIATMTDRPQVETVLRRHDIGSYIAFVMTTPEIGCGKTEPDIFLQAAARLGSAVERTLVVEDSRTALKTAICAGFPVVVSPADGVDYSDIRELARQNSTPIYFARDFSVLLPIDN